MDLATRQDLERILDFYKRNELREKPPNIGTAYWEPTPLSILLEEIILIDIWYSLENKKHEGKALVPGAGDGRRAACLARLGYNVVAVEINPELVRASNHFMDMLAAQGLINSDKVTIIEGYFLEDITYLSRGMKFEDFTKIFSYLLNANFARLARKVEKNSSAGTELFALRHVEWPVPDLGLKKIKDSGIIRSDSVTLYYELFRYRKESIS